MAEIRITVTGANDTPTVAAATATATLVEAGGVANGTAGTAASSISLTKGDVDGSATYDTAAMVTAGWAEAEAGVTYTKTGTYGTATFTVATGLVSYALNNSDGDTQALTAASHVTDSFTVQVTDGVATSNVSAVFHIDGANDAAVLSSATKNLTETNAVLTTGGTLTITDVDSAQTYVAQAGTAGSYGTFVISTAGVWTYTASSAHNEFEAGATYTDSFNVGSADGTASTVTVTIAGTNDAAVLSSATKSLTETDAALTTGGTPDHHRR